MKDIFIIVGFILLSSFIAVEVGIAPSILILLSGVVAHYTISFTAPEIIGILANIGLLMLLYIAGLEIDFDLLREELKPAFVMGFSSFIFPFAAVFILTTYILNFAPQQALLTTIALSATSIAVIYPILRSRCGGSLDEQGKLILSAAMIAELFTISVWGFFFSKFSALLIIFIIALFIFTITFPFFGRRIFSYYKGNVVDFEFKMILFLVLGIAMLSEHAGIDAAIVAFLLGMSTSQVVVNHENLDIKLRGFVFGFFAPIFFFHVGLSLDLSSLIGNWYFIILFLIIGFAATYAGVYLIGKLVMPHLAKYVAGVFNSNLTLGIIIAIFGLKENIFEPWLYSAVIGAVVLSTMISSVLVRNK